MQAISSVINRVKDGYLATIDWVAKCPVSWVAKNPHKSTWSAVGAIVVLAVL
jgi:hypothetical protein